MIMVRAFIVSIFALLTGCASMKTWFEGAPAPSSDQSLGEQDIKGLSNREMELRVAKLWARVDELESEIVRQKERQHILEKGIRLGIVPEELKDDDANDPVLRRRQGPEKTNEAPRRQSPPLSQETRDSEIHVTVATKAAAKTRGEGAGDAEADPQGYEAAVAKAQAYFNAGKYGEAILAYETIGRDYPPSLTQGNHIYWTGLCWFYLKDYFAAKKHLEGFVKDHSQSPWLPRARLYLALVDKENGLMREAQLKLKALLKDFPEHDVADVAKLEMKKLEEQL